MNSYKCFYYFQIFTKNLKMIDENIKVLELDIRDNEKISLIENSKECYSCIINILRSKHFKISANFRDMKDARQRRQTVKVIYN